MIRNTSAVKYNCGGMIMDAQIFWQAFLDTGAPEMYLLYTKARKMESSYVCNDQGVSSSRCGVQ